LISTPALQYNLVFTRKGTVRFRLGCPQPPPIPYNSDNRRSGVALSGTQPTYACSATGTSTSDGGPLQQDWSPAWKTCGIRGLCRRHLPAALCGHPDDPRVHWRQQATARALTITVRNMRRWPARNSLTAASTRAGGGWTCGGALYPAVTLSRLPAADSFVFVNAKGTPSEEQLAGSCRTWWCRYPRSILPTACSARSIRTIRPRDTAI